MRPLLACIVALLACPHADARGKGGGTRGPPDTLFQHFPEPKYFHEGQNRIHYDDRYSHRALPEPEQLAAIRVLMQTYLATFRDLKIQTWLMHGSLLGWWWGKKVMPWDFDADVQVSEGDMYLLATHYNMSVYYYRYEDIPAGRSFLLEVNPHYVHRGSDDRLNVIDARWIDMENGLFIDITAARYAIDHPRGEGVLRDKNGHEFRDTYLYPLLDSTFEGVEVKIPFRYRDMLKSEYGEQALKNTKFHGHEFNVHRMEWIDIDNLEEVIEEE